MGTRLVFFQTPSTSKSYLILSWTLWFAEEDRLTNTVNANSISKTVDNTFTETSILIFMVKPRTVYN